MISTVLEALKHRGVQSWLQSAWLLRNHRGSKNSFFAIAIAELSLVRLFALLSLIFFISETWGGFPKLINEWLEQSNLVFWIGDNRFEAFAGAIALGALVYWVFKRLWLPLLICALAFAGGWLAVNWALGFFNGLILGFWFSQVMQARREDLDLLFQRGMQFKFGLQILNLILIIAFSNELNWMTRSVNLGQTLNQVRFFQSVFAIGLSLCSSLSLSGLVFHFYFWIFHPKS